MNKENTNYNEYIFSEETPNKEKYFEFMHKFEQESSSIFKICV